MIFAVLATVVALADQTTPINIPVIRAETLGGAEVKIPEAFVQNPTWIVIGFTRTSQKSTEACSVALEKEFPGRGYVAAVLQGVPFFVKGLIKRGIAKSTPSGQHDRYLLFFEGKEELMRLVDFDKKHEDDAYIVGVARKDGVSNATYRLHSRCDSNSVRDVIDRAR